MGLLDGSEFQTVDFPCQVLALSIVEQGSEMVSGQRDTSSPTPSHCGTRPGSSKGKHGPSPGYMGSKTVNRSSFLVSDIWVAEAVRSSEQVSHSPREEEEEEEEGKHSSLLSIAMANT